MTDYKFNYSNPRVRQGKNESDVIVKVGTSEIARFSVLGYLDAAGRKAMAAAKLKAHLQKVEAAAPVHPSMASSDTVNDTELEAVE